MNLDATLIARDLLRRKASLDARRKKAIELLDAYEAMAVEPTLKAALMWVRTDYTELCAEDQLCEKLAAVIKEEQDGKDEIRERQVAPV